MVPWREISKTFQISEFSVNSSPIFFDGERGKICGRQCYHRCCF